MNTQAVMAFKERMDSVTRKDPELSKGATIFLAGRLLIEAKATLSAKEFQSLLLRLPFLISQQTGKMTVDKAQRLMTIGRIDILSKHLPRLPDGWAAMRQIPCLWRAGGDAVLRKAFQDGSINSGSTREQLDVLRSFARGEPIAARHCKAPKKPNPKTTNAKGKDRHDVKHTLELSRR